MHPAEFTRVAERTLSDSGLWRELRLPDAGTGYLVLERAGEGWGILRGSE
jgi:hypothetical protein